MNLTLKSGEEVVDRFNTHLHPEIELLLPEALLKIESKGRKFLREQIDFGRVVGTTTCVWTKLGDKIIYAKRPRRFGLTRFVKNRPPEPTQFLSIILKVGDIETGKYVLVSAYIGELGEPEPWDRNVSENSVRFWNSHALIWSSEETIPGTEIKKRPW